MSAVLRVLRAVWHWFGTRHAIAFWIILELFRYVGAPTWVTFLAAFLAHQFVLMGDKRPTTRGSRSDLTLVVKADTSEFERQIRRVGRAARRS